MAEGFDAYFHLPQQSRRDKMIAFMAQNSTHHHVLPPHHFQGCSAPYPIYDTSISSSSELIHSPANYYNSDLSLSAEVTAKQATSSIMNAASSTSSSSPPANYIDSHVNALPSLLMNPLSQICCNVEVVGSKPHSLFTTGQSLSLSLSSHHSDNQRRYYRPTIYGECAMGGSTRIEASKTAGPPPASILRGSKFWRPTQQLLEQLRIDISGGAGKSSIDLSFMDPPGDYSLRGFGSLDDHVIGGKKYNLLSMLDEVCKRYKQYYQQIQGVAASIEAVPGFGDSAPHANILLKAMSESFKSVKAAIADQLQASATRYQTASGGQQPIWRPQRGLPERAVAVLRAWLFEHFLHPYPTDTDKLMLAKQTGLSRNQVSNWFINARVRLWKPMVEEIHMLESREASKDARAAVNEVAELPRPGVSGSGRVSLSLGLQRLASSERGASQGYGMGGFEGVGGELIG